MAVKKYILPQTPKLLYLLGDHLGSTSLSVSASSGEVIETRYKPWGEVRYTTPNKTLPTRYTFTGQYSYIADDATDLGNAGFGLMFYNARWYDPYLGRFAQADTIVPRSVQGLDRYAYTLNNPLRYIDPSGHESVCGSSYSDPECPTEETTEESGCAEQYSDPDCQETSGPLAPPAEELLEEVWKLVGFDQTLYDYWLMLYYTQSGNDLALYIVQQGIEMQWSGSNRTKCSIDGCIIYIDVQYRPSVWDSDKEIDVSEAVAVLGHEAYHATVHITEGSSQWEEAMAFYIQDQIYFELTGEHKEVFTSLYVTDEKSLQTWIDEYHPDPYGDYDPYPGFP